MVKFGIMFLLFMKVFSIYIVQRILLVRILRLGSVCLVHLGENR